MEQVTGSPLLWCSVIWGFPKSEALNKRRKPEIDTMHSIASTKSNVQLLVHKLKNKNLGLGDPSRTQKPVKSHGVSDPKDGGLLVSCSSGVPNPNQPTGCWGCFTAHSFLLGLHMEPLSELLDRKKKKIQVLAWAKSSLKSKVSRNNWGWAQSDFYKTVE